MYQILPWNLEDQLSLESPYPQTFQICQSGLEDLLNPELLFLQTFQKYLFDPVCLLLPADQKMDQSHLATPELL
jgi:hypothetical protein